MKVLLILITLMYSSVFAEYSITPIIGQPVIGTTSNSAFEANIGICFLSGDSEVSAIEDILPQKFELEHNYPNPFNPSTTITFALPRAQHVTIKVFDIMGREIAELVNNNVKAGVHKLNFDGGRLASGQYFYKIETKGFSKIRKMLLVK